jgi:hypothetical protein
MSQKDYINDFFVFLFKTDPLVVDRILTDLENENKCGKAPLLAKKFVKEMRKGDTIKKLAKVNKKDVFSTLLTASTPALLILITDLVKELASVKNKECRVSQKGGAKKTPKKSGKRKSKKTPKKSGKRSAKKTPKKSGKRKSKKNSRTPCYRDKVAQVMGEFKRGKLKTSAGMKVKNRSQAIAIALSSADRNC